MNRQKGIVFENTSSYSIFLTDDGRFLKGIPDSLSEVGEEVSFRPYVELVAIKKPKRTAYTAPLIAAVAIVFMFFSVLLPSQSKVSAYVQLDFNPSIELGIDSQGDVQVFRGLNEDGIVLKRDISFWKGKSLTWVLSKIVDESNVTFEKDDQFEVTTIISEKQNQEALEKIITTAVTKTTVKITPEKIKLKQATIEDRLQANEKGVSVGTYKESQEKNLKENSIDKPAKSQPNGKKDEQKENKELQKNKDQKPNNGNDQKKNNQHKNKEQKINNSKQKDNDDQKNKEKQNNSNKQKNKEKNSNQSHSKSTDRFTNSSKDKKPEIENRTQKQDSTKNNHDYKKNSHNKSQDNKKAQKHPKNNNDHQSKRSNEKRNDR